MTSTIDNAIDRLLTRPQKKAVARMTPLGFSRLDAVRRLVRLGMLAQEIKDLESDLLFGTAFILSPSDRTLDKPSQITPNQAGS